MGNMWMFGTCSRDIGNVDQEVLGCFSIPNKKRNTYLFQDATTQKKTIVNTAVNTRTYTAISSTFTALQSDLKRVAIAMQSPASLIWSNFIWNKDTATEQDSNCLPYGRWTTCSTPWAIVRVTVAQCAWHVASCALCDVTALQDQCDPKSTV